jgi:Aspartyl protease
LPEALARHIIADVKCSFVALYLLVLVLAGCGQGSGCDLVQLVVPVTVNGSAIRMLLDTGGEKSLLAEATVQWLGVTRDGRTYTVLAGLAGGSMRTDATDAAAVK